MFADGAQWARRHNEAQMATNDQDKTRTSYPEFRTLRAATAFARGYVDPVAVVRRRGRPYEVVPRVTMLRWAREGRLVSR
jgi:hypothetical protein